jgi:plasmid stabilization system protein ParE
MARVVVAPSAREDLAHLITVLNLPENTRARVKARLRLLAATPEQGAPLDGRWGGFRFVLGPWPWMLIIYAYDDKDDRVGVVTIQDARRAHAATAEW